MEIRNQQDWREEAQYFVDEGYLRGAGIELREIAHMLHLEALEKAIPMAEAGWKIYCFDVHVAVLVRPEGYKPWWEQRHRQNPG